MPGHDHDWSLAFWSETALKQPESKGCRGMREQIEEALTDAGVVAAVPIAILNWAAVIVAIVWLIAIAHWEFLLAGLLTGLAAELIFELLLVFTPVIARKLRTNLSAAIYALKLFRAATYLLVLLYTFYVFKLALVELQLSFPLRLAWAYAVAVTPFAVMSLRARTSDPMAIIWPTTAGYGAVATAIAFISGAPHLAPVAQVCGSFVGLYFGWRLGMRRVLMRLRRPQPAY
jgi:hypothetical protein